MRICVSGTCSQGKSTFIEDFLTEWPLYETPEQTYRSHIKSKHSKRTCQDLQWKILNAMIDTLQKYDKDDKVIYDRGPLDNIVYTLWAQSKGITDIDEKFVQKCIPLIRETYKFLDIIFFIPITKVATVEYDKGSYSKDKKLGNVDDEHRSEIDNLFKALKYDWANNDESKFFDSRDKPAIIDIFGNPLERIQIVKLYLDTDGDIIGDTPETVKTEEELKEIEAMKAQFGIADKQTEAFGNPQGYQ